MEKEHLLLYMSGREKVRELSRNKVPLIGKHDENIFLKETVISLIMNCFKAQNCRLPNKKRQSKEESMEILRTHVEKLLMKFSTYIIIDDSDIKDYINRKEIVQKMCDEPGQTGKKIHPVDIYGVMIVEKNVQFKDAVCTLIHFLCIKRGYEGLSYANKLMKFAFTDR